VSSQPDGARVTPGRLRAMIERFELFEPWWGWLRDFQADGDGPVAGNALHAMVASPVPSATPTSSCSGVTGRDRSRPRSAAT
jgi:hypothetical protein